jgi:hypothetical protein
MSQETHSQKEATKAIIELLLLAVFVLSALLAETVLRGAYSAVFSGNISLAQGVLAALRFFSLVWALTVFLGVVHQFRREKMRDESFFGLIQIALLVTGCGVIGAVAGAIFLVAYATPPVDCSSCAMHALTYGLFVGAPFLVLTVRHFLMTERLRQSVAGDPSRGTE